MDAELKDFIRHHENDDPVRLRFRYHNDPRPWMAAALSHIEALPKGRRKFGSAAGTEDGWPRLFPSRLAVEQATPPEVAWINAMFVNAGDRVLDMTAGLGSDDREMALRGARLTIFDLNEANAGALRENFSDLPDVEVFCGDSVEWLGRYAGQPFDVIFIDPARRDANGGRVYNLRDCTPDITEHYALMARNSRRLVAKLSPMLDITQTFRDLPDCREIHVMEQGGEVRQLLAVCDFGSDSGLDDGDRRVVVHGPGWRYDFTMAEAAETDASIVEPKAGDILIEPTPAMMKAGAFPLVASRFGWDIVSAQSHLFVSEKEPAGDTPGRKMRVVAVYRLTSSSLKKIGKEIGGAEIAVRNLPGFTPESLRKRLGIADSSARRLVGTTLADGNRVLILCDKTPDGNQAADSKHHADRHGDDVGGI